MIERILRKVFKAPTIHKLFNENKAFPAYTVGLTEFDRQLIGVEPGEQAYLDTELVIVYDSDEAVASTHLIGFLGHGPHPIRRRVLSRVTRHLVGAAWTLAGMMIVLLTLSGTVQVLSLIVCVLFFALDLMSISLREP